MRVAYISLSPYVISPGTVPLHVHSVGFTHTTNFLFIRSLVNEGCIYFLIALCYLSRNSASACTFSGFYAHNKWDVAQIPSAFESSNGVRPRGARVNYHLAVVNRRAKSSGMPSRYEILTHKIIDLAPWEWYPGPAKACAQGFSSGRSSSGTGGGSR